MIEEPTRHPAHHLRIAAGAVAQIENHGVGFVQVLHDGFGNVMARCRIGEPVEFDVADVAGMQFELFKGALLQHVSAPDLFLDLFGRSLNVGVALGSRGGGAQAPDRAGEPVVGSSVVHHKDEKSKSGDRKDAARHNRTRQERLFFEAAERGNPCGQLPGLRRRWGHVGVPVCLREARGEVGQQVDPETQSS